MTDYNSIEQRLQTLIGEKTKLDAADISPDLNLEASGLDSFARIELVLAIEEEFGVEFSDSESANVATIEDLTKSLFEKIQQKTGAA